MPTTELDVRSERDVLLWSPSPVVVWSQLDAEMPGQSL